MPQDARTHIPEEIENAAEALSANDIADLVSHLDDKTDATRYRALLLLTARSEKYPDVLPHWPRFRQKLTDGNSYQRSIGILMIAANARWAEAGAALECLPDCLRLIEDEKPITARQAIQSLGRIAQDVSDLAPRIAEALMGLDLLSVRETMRKLLLTDVCNALLLLIDDARLRDPVREFLMNALSGDILDKAAKKELRNAMAL
jgi:hypothetical protein